MSGALPLKKRLLVYSGSGTVTMDYFVPILPDLARDWTVDFLEGDFAPSSSAKRWMDRFVSERTVASYTTAPVQKRGGSDWAYQKALVALIGRLQHSRYDLFLLGTDCYVIDRYLIRMARSNGAKVAVMHTNILNPNVLNAYRASQGLGFLTQRGTPARPKKNFLMRKATSLLNRARAPWRSMMNETVIPYLLTGRALPRAAYEKFSFTSGLADVVLFYDEMELNAYRHSVPAVTSAVVTKHPARTPLGVRSLAGSRDLLVLLSSYSDEMPEEKINFWVRSISQVLACAGLKEAHLRFHPRTNPTLCWPASLQQKLTVTGVNFKVMPASDLSLVESIHGYAGAVGAYSGSLRTARAASDSIFVIGLLEAGDPVPFEAPWVLGNSEGIVWIARDEQITPALLAVPLPKDAERPTVPEFLKTWARPAAISSSADEPLRAVGL